MFFSVNTRAASFLRPGDSVAIHVWERGMNTHGSEIGTFLKFFFLGILIFAYALSFPFLFGTVGRGAALFSFFPTICSLWFFGPFAACAAAAAMTGGHVFLFRHRTVWDAAVLFQAALPCALGLPAAFAFWGFQNVFSKVKSISDRLSIEKEGLKNEIERKEYAEKCIHECEQNYRHCIDLTSDAVFSFDLHGNFIFVNPSGYRLIGYDAATLKMMKYTDCIARGYAEKIKKSHIRQYLSGTTNLYRELPCVTRNDEIRWIGYTATLLSESGGGKVFHVVARNITPRIEFEHSFAKELETFDSKILERTAELTKANQALQIEIRERAWVEEALRNSEEKYRSLVEGLHDVVFQTDADYCLSFLNPAWCTITGIALEACRGKCLFDYIVPEEREAVRNTFEKIRLRESTYERSQFSIQTPSGDIRFIEADIYAILSEDMAFLGTDGLLKDVTEVTAAQAALRESKEFLDKIVNSLVDPIFVKDTEHRWILLNDAFCKAVGSSKEELLYTRDDAIFPKEQTGVFWESDNLVLQSGQEHVGEERVFDRSHEPHTLLIKKAIYIDDKNNKFVVGISRDITEQKEIENQIKRLNSDLDLRVRERTAQLETANQELRREIQERRRAEERLRMFEHAMRSIGDAVYIADDDTVLFVNPAFCEMYGYSYEEIQGHPLEVLWLRKESDSNHETIKQKALEDGWKGDLIHRRKDGSEFPVFLSASLIQDNEESALKWIGIIRDITEQRAVAQELNILSQAVEQSPVSILISDLSGKIQYVNSRFCEVTGYAKEEAIGKNPRILKSGETKMEEYDKLWKMIGSGGAWSGTLRNRRKSGDLYWDSTIIFPIKNIDSCVTHYIAMKEDITEKIKLEAQVRRSQRLEVIGTLAGGIAHDLNNVLSPILMAVQLLRIKMVDPKGLNLLTTLEATVNRGADIVKQVLSFARGVEGDRILIQPKHLLREVQEIMHETFPRLVEIKSDIPKDLWPVIGDATQLHQVFMNLCVNARDAMPHGGTLRVKAENIELNEKQASLHLGAQSGPYVLISVSDTGIGIPQNHLDKIFDPFFTTKEIGKGTGLGLSTVTTIVKSHKGFLTVYSEIDRGTEFKIYIPASLERNSEQREARPSEPPQGRGELVLLIDDEASIREVTRQLLENAQYRVLDACDGVEALEIFKKHRNSISVVITDMMMPHMDGSAVIRELQQLNPEVKIIAASGLLNNENMPGIHSPNVHAFLPKPFKPEKMFWTLDALLH
jgi:PAS domain S-box-containing protein